MALSAKPIMGPLPPCLMSCCTSSMLVLLPAALRMRWPYSAIVLTRVNSVADWRVSTTWRMVSIKPSKPSSAGTPWRFAPASRRWAAGRRARESEIDMEDPCAELEGDHFIIAPTWHEVYAGDLDAGPFSALARRGDQRPSR